MALDETIIEGQAGHDTDHELIAGQLNRTPEPVKTLGQYYFSSYDHTNITDVPTQSRLMLVPVLLPAGTIDRIGVDCATGVASLVARLGVYSGTADFPVTLIAEATGTASLTTSGVMSDLTISAVLPTVGIYWLAVVCQGATPVAGSLRCAAGGLFVPMPLGTSAPSTAFGTAPPNNRYVDSVTGALPATPTINNGMNLVRPRLHYRFSA